MIRARSLENAVRVSVIMAGDSAIACACLSVAVYVRRSIEMPWTRSLLPPTKFPLGPAVFAIFAASLLVASGMTGFYTSSTSTRHRPTLFLAIPLQVGIVGVIAVLAERPWPRSVFIIAPLIEGVVLPAWRLLLRRSWQLRSRSLVVIGQAPELREFVSDIQRQPQERITIEGFVSVDEPLDDPLYLGRFGDSAATAALQRTADLIDLGGDSDELRRLSLLALRGPRGFLFVPQPSDSLLVSTRFEVVGGRLVSEVRVRAASGVARLAKRLFDIVAGLVLLILLSPVLLLIACVVALDTGRPVLIRQQRLGWLGRTFRMWKFRTMRTAATGTALATDNDLRITRSGRTLRRYRLDELPQLLNVIAGEMSLVGPRPEIPEVAHRIEQTLPGFGLRLLVRPGIAGLAQVSGEYDQAPATKLGFDLQYACSWSFLLDLRLLAQAITAGLAGRGL